MSGSQTNLKRRARLGAGGGAGGGGGAIIMGGDVTGDPATSTVVGIQGVPVDGAPLTSSDVLKYNPDTGHLEWHSAVHYAISGAAAAAAGPYLLDETVVIYPGATAAEAGTYQITSNDGTTFPGDYTKVSDDTNTASEVGVVDTDDHFNGVNAEDVLKEIATGAIRGIKFNLLVGTNVADLVPHATYRGGDWAVMLTKGSLAYKTLLSITHDGALAAASEYGSTPGNGLSTMPISFDADITGVNLRVLMVASEAGWSCHIRRIAMMEA